jgi:phthiocerol/phenolphthiocerol synthesis type-I polyketide synthase E
MEVTPALAEEHFRPKVRGLLALDRVLPTEGLDFCVLMSSLSAVLGGLGFLPYAAANIFMDAFAEARARVGKTRWISIDWDGWALDDPAEDEISDIALSPEDGLEALGRILARVVGPQVVVSTHNLDQRLQQWVELADARTDEPDDEQDGGALHSRPPLRSEFLAPRTAAEEQIAQLWQRLLGVDRVGVDDNFFELGGHSLLALQLTARLRETFRVDVSAERVLAAPTVALLASEVDRATEAAGQAQATIEQMLTRIEQMSDEQVRILLAEKEAAPEAPASEA